MEFRDNEPIYLQIAAYVGENILLKKWQADQKIPSVRDLAVELQVNLNTVLHAYEFLESQGVIYIKRGLGNFVASDGQEKVKAYRKERFIQQDLPVFFTNVYLLGISQEEILQRYEQFSLHANISKTSTDDENK
ncbi:MAG TPA: GntR family transcriptional regulator [Puia sp.]|nr:GntR family transcriptional regulator [Puia sp.]